MTHLGLLDHHFGSRANELRSHAGSGAEMSGSLTDAALRVWQLSQLWLTFLDGEDFGLTIDEAIYNQIVGLAQSPPRCSIEEEAVSWMYLTATEMTEFEITLALMCAVDRVGTVLVWSGQFDELRGDLIEHRRRTHMQW